MTDDVKLNGFKVQTKFIPYELVMDFPNCFDMSNLIKNRVSFDVDPTSLVVNLDIGSIIFIAERFIHKCGKLSGRWTAKTIMYTTSVRVEVMMENDYDFEKLKEVLIMDKLSSE